MAVAGRGHEVFPTEDALLDAFFEYLDFCLCEGRLANDAGFAAYRGISRKTLYAAFSKYPDAEARIADCIEDETLNNRKIDRQILILYLKNKCGYTDKAQIDGTTTIKIDITD